ncbi:hypothetical protein M8C21_014465, partial [Ambrosia artemisiifolia]
MGACLSTTKISGSNSTTAGKHDVNVNHHKPKEIQRDNNNNKQKQKEVVNIPCGKRTDFGYNKDFDGDYSIGKLLGHGQFGYTYVAIDKANGDRVAVKKIDKNKMKSPAAVEDVKREVKILQALSGHENVVQFHNAYEDSSYVYIVMELCEGGELLDRILGKKDSRYSEKDAAIVVRQMLKVAAECHLHGLVHRDMKPEALASTLDEEELSDLKDQFQAIDVDKSGAISLEEMKQALAKDLPWKIKESRVSEILEAIDSNTDGLIDFKEFVAATLHVHQLEEHNSEKWQHLSQAAFEKFDVDKDGYITPEELRVHTGLKGSIDPLLEEADIDKD